VFYYIEFLVLLQLKHFIFDFCLQSTSMIHGKKTYGNLYSIQHSLYHGVGTALVSFLFLPINIVALVAIIDFVAHYHIDYFKSKCVSNGYEDKRFWIWFGLDQFLHQLTYIILLALAVWGSAS